MRESKDKSTSIGMLAILCALGVFYALMAWFHSYTGDDLEYRAGWLYDYDNNLLNYPLCFVRHWLHVNGRFADKINPFMLAMSPKWLFVVLNGVVSMLMYWSVLKCTEMGRKTGAIGAVTLICVVMFCLTWWDYMVVYVCNLNYIWSVAFALTALVVILSIRDNLKRSNISIACLCLFVFVAGAMHEACGAPLACGILVWIYFSGQKMKLNRIQKILIVAFLVGAIFPITSPGAWRRFGNGGMSDNVPAEIVLFRSAYLTLAMLLWIIIGLMIRPMREKFKQLIRTPWVIFVIAAVASLPFCAVSGIIGRTGWFSQIFAIVAVFYYYNATGFSLNRRLAAVLSIGLVVLLVAHCFVTLRQQYVMGRELMSMIDLYRRSPDGVVYMDYIRDSEQHPFALRKARGVHDPEETYYIETITRYYGSEDRPLVVVPEAIEKIPAAEIAGIEPVGDCFVSDSYVGERDGYVVVPFTKEGRRLYLYRPHEIDPDNPTFNPLR